MDSRAKGGVRPRIDAARTGAGSGPAARDRRAPARRDPEGGSGARSPQRGVEGNRRGEEEQRGGGGAGADGRGGAAQDRDSRAGGRSQEAFRGARQGAGVDS